MRAQALCICPTRELVVQNLSVLERMARFTSISATSTAATDSRFSRCAVVELSCAGSGRSGRVSSGEAVLAHLTLKHSSAAVLALLTLKHSSAEH